MFFQNDEPDLRLRHLFASLRQPGSATTAVRLKNLRYNWHTGGRAYPLIDGSSLPFVQPLAFKRVSLRLDQTGVEVGLEDGTSIPRGLKLELHNVDETINSVNID